MDALESAARPPIIICAFDKSLMSEYFKLADELRRAGLRAEVFIGSGNVTKQMKYADRRGAQIAVLMGEDELAKGEVTLKDLYLGAKMAEAITSNEEWKESRPAQKTAKRTDIVSAIKSMMA